MTQTNADWLQQRIQYIQTLKTPNEQQQLLAIMGGRSDLGSDEKKKLAILIKAEKADEKAQQAKAELKQLLQTEKKAQRKQRDRELYNSAGLLILADLVDTKTGKPKIDRAELLGALVSLSQVAADHPKRHEWRQSGQILLQKGAESKTESIQEQPSEPDQMRNLFVRN